MARAATRSKACAGRDVLATPQARNDGTLCGRRPWLTRRHGAGENVRDPASESLKFEAYLKSDRFQKALDIAMNMFAEADASFPWLAGTMLAFEACEVIRLRLTKFASADDDADDEARLMVSEKIDAMFEAGASVMSGASAASIIGRYREHVAANAKRLSVA
jgi:hypothetical protein